MVAAAGAALLTTLTTAADLALGRTGLLLLAAGCITGIAGAYRVFLGRDGAA
jgi:hypothetical protein